MTLKDLQQKQLQNNLQACYVTLNNMFLDLDVLKEENKIFELTGFTGSSGSLLVTPNEAWLMVDGRYSLQARQETDSKLLKVVDTTFPPVTLQGLCRKNGISELAYNPWCLSVRDFNYVKNMMPELLLKPVENLYGHILSEQPVNVFKHELKFAGKTSAEKRLEIGQKIPPKFAAILLTAADSVSWLMNLRSHTLPNTPVFRAWALLDRSGMVHVYADHCTYPEVKPFNKLSEDLKQYAGKIVLADIFECPQKIFDFVPSDVQLDTYGSNPVTAMKLGKNPIELEGFRQAHIRDGIAVVKFLHWLDHNWQDKSEWDIAQKLKQFRQQQPLFFSDSFATIAAAGANAAIVHYEPTEQKNALLENNSVLLLDSGAQYYDGTTDVTRVIALGTPPAEMVDSFTQVLKAHIKLASSIFPDSTTGISLDTIARHILWQYGKNFAHGTGHSVGHFSNVHEAPFRISPSVSLPVRKHYVTSIEPGYYKEGHYGIRIENMVYTEKADIEGYLKFTNLTLIPIDKRLINSYLLSSGEQAWLNSYHQKVFSCLAPFLDTDETDWLKSACSPI